MILDQIKQLHNTFGQIDASQASVLGFTPRIEGPNRLKPWLYSGKWSSLSFSWLEELELSTAIKIVPYIDSKKWPVYDLLGDGGKFYASDMLTYILFVHIERLIENPDLCKKYSERWQNIYETVLPVYKLFGGQDDLKSIKDIVFDPALWPKPDQSYDIRIAKYRSFCLEHDHSYGNQYLWNLLDNLISSESFLPELPDNDLGIYTARIMKLSAMRAYTLLDDFPFQKLEEPMLLGFAQPQGYDTETTTPDYTPSGPGSELSNIKEIMRTLFQPWNLEVSSPKIQSFPEYKVAKALSEQGGGSFTGMEFLEAAAILDEELNQPVRAWNCLVSAGYWAGMNMPKGQETIVKAAIYLCEKHNWTDAAQVLNNNLDIMQSA